MDIQNPEKIEIEGLKTIHKLCKFGANHNMEGCSFTEIVERMFDELSKVQAAPEGFVLVESSELEQLKLDSEYFEKSCVEWTNRAYEQRAKVDHIKNEVEKFKQSGTSLDLGCFLESLIELSTFKRDAELFKVWQETKAIPEGFVLVPVKEIKTWYLDESENFYREDPDWLCDTPVSEVVEVEHRISYELDQDPVFAAIQWDDENDDIGYYEIFKTKEEAEKVAAHCKAMIEAQEQGLMDFDLNQIELVMTCAACPEQYDAFYKGKQVGYLRLRHGEFRVDFPTCGDETIFYSEEMQGDGMFEDDEREHFLMKAKEAIAKKLKEEKEEG